MRTPSAAYGLLGALPEDLVLDILAHVDTSTLLAAEAVSRSWHAIITRSKLWREQYLAFPDVDLTAKWRCLSLDLADERLESTEAAASMPAGDGRGVSGPPLDTVSRYRLALDSHWATQFDTEVIAKLPDDSPIRASIFGKDGNVREPVLPDANDLLSEWGTRRDKPNWRQLVLCHLAARSNWRAGKILSTITVPLHIPRDWRLRFNGYDPGDDGLIFTALTHRVPKGHFLICVEPDTGSIRHVTVQRDWPPADDWRPTQNIGLCGVHHIPKHHDSNNFFDPFVRPSDLAEYKRLSLSLYGNDDNSLENGEDFTRLSISGRAFNHLCREKGMPLRDKHFQVLGFMRSQLARVEVGRRGSHLEVARIYDSTPQWERATERTFEYNAQRVWDVSATPHSDYNGKKYCNHTISLFGEYTLLFNDSTRPGEDPAMPEVFGKVRVCSRRTGEIVVTLPTFHANGSDQVEVHQLPPFAYHLETGAVIRQGGGTRDMGRIEVRTLDLEGYCDLMEHLIECGEVISERILQLHVEGVWFHEGGPGVISLGSIDGCMIIPHMHTVLDGAKALAPEERAAYVAHRSVIVSCTGRDGGRLAMECSKLVVNIPGGMIVLDIDDLPLICADQPPPILSGGVIVRNNPGDWWIDTSHFFGTFTLDLLRRDEQRGEQWGSSRVMLRINSLGPKQTGQW